jgi:hypothetical protein
VAVITSLSLHDDTSEVSDLRARIAQQLIAAAKSGRRRVPFGELFEHHGKRSSASIGWCEIAKTGKEQSTMSTGNSFNAHHEISDRVRSKGPGETTAAPSIPHPNREQALKRARLTAGFPNVVNGQRVDFSRQIKISDPVTGEELASVTDTQKDGLDQDYVSRFCRRIVQEGDGKKQAGTLRWNFPLIEDRSLGLLNLFPRFLHASELGAVLYRAQGGLGIKPIAECLTWSTGYEVFRESVTLDHCGLFSSTGISTKPSGWPMRPHMALEPLYGVQILSHWTLLHLGLMPGRFG